MNIQFIRANQQDILDLIQIQNEAFYTDYLIYGSSPEYNRSYESMKKDVVESMVYKIVVDERLVGDIIVKQRGNGQYALDSLCVIPEFENKGIGKAAIEFVEATIKDAEHWVATIPADKRRNKCFYIKAGYHMTQECVNGKMKLAILEKDIPA